MATTEEMLKQHRDIPHFGPRQMVLTVDGKETVRLEATLGERQQAVDAWCKSMLDTAAMTKLAVLEDLECQIIRKKAALAVLEFKRNALKDRQDEEAKKSK